VAEGKQIILKNVKRKFPPCTLKPDYGKINWSFNRHRRHLASRLKEWKNVKIENKKLEIQRKVQKLKLPNEPIFTCPGTHRTQR